MKPTAAYYRPQGPTALAPSGFAAQRQAIRRSPIGGGSKSKSKSKRETGRTPWV